MFFVVGFFVFVYEVSLFLCVPPPSPFQKTSTLCMHNICTSLRKVYHVHPPFNIQLSQWDIWWKTSKDTVSFIIHCTIPAKKFSFFLCANFISTAVSPFTSPLIPSKGQGSVMLRSSFIWKLIESFLLWNRYWSLSSSFKMGNPNIWNKSKSLSSKLNQIKKHHCNNSSSESRIP